ncbi:kinesin-like protein KIF11 [Saccoglossus kowalevskii]
MTSTKSFKNKVLPREAHVQVAVRCRPLNEQEKQNHSPTILRVNPHKKEVNIGQSSSTGKHALKTFTFDKDPLAGIVPRTLHQLFESLQQMKVEFTIRVSFLEIYQEELFDLLGDGEEKLRMFEDNSKKGSVVVQGLEEKTVHTKDEVYAILEYGCHRRQTATTKMNDHSRKIAILTFNYKNGNSSSKSNHSINSGADVWSTPFILYARSLSNINQSLLTLGRVITGLVEHAPHIPYRESKLTRLLQDSLGGRTKTSIIATVSPALCNYEESLSTLDYAHRAKNITNRPEVNQKMTKRALIKEYTEEIEKLKRDLHAAREKHGIFMSSESYSAMEHKMESQVQTITDLEQKIATFEEEVKKIDVLFQELQQTKYKLETTAVKLGQTRQNLLETTIERDKQMHLVDTHVKTEGELYEKANQLLNVTTSSVKDLDGVHGKLDRKKSVENHNLGAQEKFQKLGKNNLSAMKANVHRHSSGQMEWLDQMQDSCGKIVFAFIRSA